MELLGQMYDYKKITRKCHTNFKRVYVILCSQSSPACDMVSHFDFGHSGINVIKLIVTLICISLDD